MRQRSGVELKFSELSRTVTAYNRCQQNGVRAAEALGITTAAFRHRLRSCLTKPELKARVIKAANELSYEAKKHDAHRIRTVAQDQQARLQKTAQVGLQRRYDQALDKISKLERDVNILGRLRDAVETTRILPKYGHGTSEGTVVVLASDWHVEEEVGDEVGGLNRYTLDIAKERAETFFRGAVRLTKLLQQDIKIDNMVLALLGDFITNDIHDELVELNQETPVESIVFAQNRIIAGIDYILEHTKLNLTIPCHSGNHGRTTKTTRFSTERGHSLEYLMFLHLAAHFRNEHRVKFKLAPGYHSYMDVYDRTIRFHHGHAIKYGGGVGGIFIPTYKAIAQWNKALPKAPYLDCFGHFHQLKDGGNFISNGSLIGYNGFAIAIKADFEPPKQAMFLVDKKRGRTCTWPILPDFHKK